MTSCNSAGEFPLNSEFIDPVLKSVEVPTGHPPARWAVKFMSVRIMHISDLHLGEDIIGRALWRRRAWWGTANPAITDGLKKAIRELQPDYIVISGDFVNKAQDETFLCAANYLRQLFLDSGFDIRERFVAGLEIQFVCNRKGRCVPGVFSFLILYQFSFAYAP